MGQANSIEFVIQKATELRDVCRGRAPEAVGRGLADSEVANVQALFDEVGMTLPPELIEVYRVCAAIGSVTSLNASILFCPEREVTANREHHVGFLDTVAAEDAAEYDLLLLGSGLMGSLVIDRRGMVSVEHFDSWYVPEEFPHTFAEGFAIYADGIIVEIANAEKRDAEEA